MDLAERGFEHRRHLNDLLPSPAHASGLAGGARPRDGQDVYECRRDANRVRRSYFDPRGRRGHHICPEWSSRVCVWLCLEHVLR